MRVFFVAAASSPSEGPSVSRHVGVRPADALGARRYEEGGFRTPRMVAMNARIFRSGGVITVGGAVGKPARRRPPDRRAWRAPLRRKGHGRDVLPWRSVSFFVAAASSPSEGPSVSWHASVRCPRTFPLALDSW